MDTREKAAEYEKKANALFGKWKSKEPKRGVNHGADIFIRDGIADPEQWFSQDVRPLFLLKEAYTKDSTYKKDWDLCDHFMGRGEDELRVTEPKECDSTWCRITQWAYGILNTSAEEAPSFEEAEKAIRNESGKVLYGNEWLSKIAVVNVKKSGGRASSSYENIEEYVFQDRVELAEQIDLIDPTVIVCGRTYDFFDMIPGMGGGFNEPSAGCYEEFLVNDHPVIVVNYWHPANRYPKIMNYYGLVSIYQQALKNPETWS